MKNRKGFLSKIIVLCLLLTIIVSAAACTQVVEFKVNFIIDGEIYKTINTAGEETISLPENPTKNGYIFDGWYWDEDVWSRPFTAESLLTEKLTADMSVYAKWINEDITKRYYTVTFNSFGGGEVDSASVLYGKTFAEPTKPTKAGYVLVGWYKEADLTTKWNFATDVVTEDITLYAKWVDESDATGSDIIAAEGFGINGNVLSIKTPNSQEHFALSNAITVSPYATWTVTTDIAGKEEIPSGTVALEVGDNTYYINVTSGNGSNKKQYTVNIRRREIYTLTYVFNNCDKNAVMQIEEDGKPENKQVEKTGYTFVEWKNGEKAWDFENDVISGNTTLEAVWSANEYDVTFDSAGGNAVEPVKATYDSAYSWEAPEKTGYTFLGWKAGEVMLTDENGDSLSVWKITENTEVVAVWEIITYNITYGNLKGADNPNVSTYTVEDEVIFAAVAQDGYTFIEWQGEDGNAIQGIEKGSTGNRTIKAVWSAIDYNITYHLDGGTNAEENPATYNVEELPVVLYDAAKPEYTFNGWYTSSDYTTQIKEISILEYDIDLYAKFTQYTEGLQFSLSDDGTYYIVSGYEGDSSDIYFANTYNDKPVKAISQMAFSMNSVIKTVSIPDSVTSIGEAAFANCGALTIYCEASSKPSDWDSEWNMDCIVVWDCNNNDVASDGYVYYVDEYGIKYAIKDGNAIVARQVANLGEEIVIPSSVSYKGVEYKVTAIGAQAFYECNLLVSVTVPDSVKDIGSQAFYNCSFLESVIFGENSQLNTIGDNAFFRCSYLTNCDIPDKVTDIGEYAFYYCASLKSITLPDGITCVKPFTFSYCRALTSITIPDSVTTVDRLAFGYCSSLTSITIPDNVIYIGDSAFFECILLIRVYYEGTYQQWSQIELDKDNYNLTNARRYYYSESEPSLNEDGMAYNGDYWRYVDGVPTLWIKEA